MPKIEKNIYLYIYSNLRFCLLTKCWRLSKERRMSKRTIKCYRNYFMMLIYMLDTFYLYLKYYVILNILRTPISVNF